MLHTIIMYILYCWYRHGEGEGGKGGPQVSDCEGFPLAPSRLASPRLVSPLDSRVSPRLEVAAAVAVTVAVLRLRLRFRYVLRCVSRKYILVALPHPSPRPAGRQDPDCRPVPTHIMLTRTILGLYTSMFSRAIPAILSCPCIFLAYSTGSLHSIPVVHFPISLTTYPDSRLHTLCVCVCVCVYHQGQFVRLKPLMSLKLTYRWKYLSTLSLSLSLSLSSSGCGRLLYHGQFWPGRSIAKPGEVLKHRYSSPNNTSLFRSNVRAHA